MSTYKQKGTAFEQLEELSQEMTGMPDANPFTAFEQWQKEREAMGELLSDNQAYEKRIALLARALETAKRAIESAETWGLFFTERTRKWIQKFNDEYKKIQESKDANQNP